MIGLVSIRAATLTRVRLRHVITQDMYGTYGLLLQLQQLDSWFMHMPEERTALADAHTRAIPALAATKTGKRAFMKTGVGT